jgi:tRNA A-37 threonylcarbamoyl transferase component Bud32
VWLFFVPKEARPFGVHTPIMDVSVNGATFDLNAYEGDKITEASVFNDSASVTFRAKLSKKVGSAVSTLVWDETVHQLRSAQKAALYLHFA